MYNKYFLGLLKKETLTKKELTDLIDYFFYQKQLNNIKDNFFSENLYEKNKENLTISDLRKLLMTNKYDISFLDKIIFDFSLEDKEIWDIITAYQQLDENFYKKYKKYINLYKITDYSKFSNNFLINIYAKKTNKFDFLYKRKISKEDIEKLINIPKSTLAQNNLFSALIKTQSNFDEKLILKYYDSFFFNNQKELIEFTDNEQLIFKILKRNPNMIKYFVNSLLMNNKKIKTDELFIFILNTNTLTNFYDINKRYYKQMLKILFESTDSILKFEQLLIKSPEIKITKNENLKKLLTDNNKWNEYIKNKKNFYLNKNIPQKLVSKMIANDIINIYNRLKNIRGTKQLTKIIENKINYKKEEKIKEI